MRALARRLWALGPANPLAAAAMRSGSRRRSHRAARTGYLGALVALWLAAMLTAPAWWGKPQIQELARAGAWVFLIVAYAQTALLGLIAPVFLAGTMQAYRDGRGLELVIATPISATRIVLGALLGRLVPVWLLLASGLPLFAVVLVFGGVPLGAVAVSFGSLALLATTLGAAAVALAASRWTSRGAVYGFVLAAVGYLAGVYAAARAVRGIDPGGALLPARLPDAVAALHPMLLVERALVGDPAIPFALFAAANAAATAMLLGTAGVALRRAAEPAGAVAAAVPAAAHRRPVGRDPIAWREARAHAGWRAGARAAYLVLASAAALALVGSYHFDGGLMEDGPAFKEALAVLLIAETALALCAALYGGASAISREREAGTLDLVLATPMTPEALLRGKLRGVAAGQGALIAAPTVTLAAAAAYTGLAALAGWPEATMSYAVPTPDGAARARFPLLPAEAALWFPVVLVPAAATCAAIGLHWSLRARGVLGAAAPSALVVLGAGALASFCGMALVGEIPLVGPAVTGLNPAAFALVLIAPWREVAGYAAAPVAGRVGLGIAAALAGGAHLGVAMLLYRWNARELDHVARRLSGT